MFPTFLNLFSVFKTHKLHLGWFVYWYLSIHQRREPHFSLDLQNTLNLTGLVVLLLCLVGEHHYGFLFLSYSFQTQPPRTLRILLRNQDSDMAHMGKIFSSQLTKALLTFFVFSVQVNPLSGAAFLVLAISGPTTWFWKPTFQLPFAARQPHHITASLS